MFYYLFTFEICGKATFQFSFSLFSRLQKLILADKVFAQINVCGEALVCDAYYLVQTSIYNFGRALLLQFSSLCSRNTTSVFYGTVVILSSVFEILAYATEMLIVVYAIVKELYLHGLKHVQCMITYQHACSCT